MVKAPQKTTSDESTQIAGANAQISGLGDLKVQVKNHNMEF